MDGAAWTFTFTGQARAGAVPSAGSVLVLDTNVISALHTVATKGIRPGHADAARVANLLRWLHSRPDVAVSPLFGILEGSGFATVGLQPFVVLQRSAAALCLVEWSRRDPEPFIASGAPPPESFFNPELLDPKAVFEAAQILLPWTVLPCWVLVLLLWKVRRAGLEGVDALRTVYAEAIRRIDYLPGLGWMSCVLVLGGAPALRRRLAERLLKFPRDEPSRDAASAAWDLGYLQLLSITRTPALEPLFDGRTPVLVTADRGLSELALELPAVGDTGGFEISAERLDPRSSDEVLNLLEDTQVERLVRIGTGDIADPDWRRCAEAIRALEDELGLARTVLPDFETEPLTIHVSAADIRRWMTVLDAHDGSSALHGLLALFEEGHEVGAAAMLTLIALLRDNAKARGTSVDDAWQAMSEGLPDGADRAQTPSILTLAVKAAMDGNWSLASGWLGKLTAHGGIETAELWLWAMTRSLLRSTAETREVSIEELLARLRNKLDAVKPETDPPKGAV